MELNFGSYWTVKLKDVKVINFNYSGSWYLLECTLEAYRKIDFLEVKGSLDGIKLISDDKVIDIESSKTKLCLKLPVKIQISGETKSINGNDTCIIGINDKSKLVLHDSSDNIVVKKVISADSIVDGKIKTKLCYTYSYGIIYNIGITANVPNVNFRSRFSGSDILDTLKGASLNAENFTKNEIAGEIESLLNPPL